MFKVWTFDKGRWDTAALGVEPPGDGRSVIDCLAVAGFSDAIASNIDKENVTGAVIMFDPNVPTGLGYRFAYVSVVTNMAGEAVLIQDLPSLITFLKEVGSSELLELGAVNQAAKSSE